MTKQEQELLEFSFDFEALSACPLCNGKVMIPNGRIRWLEIDFWYVICPDCGLKFLNPRPTIESYRDFYRDFFWQQKIRNIGFIQPGQIWQGKRYQWDNEEKWDPEFGRKNISEKLKAMRIKIITNALKNNIDLGDKAQILEVGTGFPVTLKHLKDNFGSQVYAIEPSDEARTVIKQDKEIKLIGRYAEELEQLSQGDQKFDAIIFSHSLENTVDPFSVIKFASDCLKRKGIIYVQTPHLLTFDQMNPYHPYIFCENTLRLIAEKSGLEYKQISETKDKMLTAVFLKNK
ncbi:MAG: hypothetical protein A3J62_02420 [Candidatus Buchananbacteria bacterium RIFCSPHIGHO2_02_FULL_38_8]|uniref:Methyltransferase type 11 domain-containing protein n=2 Tax=Candidatus Buchananiibacteriota TaxID=1817903 RepID=A0A1G1XXY8_9BACT|nr:MAG: hypothetical protein A2731_00715 [Candidatus Buchananbacteria bacterium RIFCSPHIGHO2_01_FULL_39_8]OGY47199.1 MAG: hypothetical protein A3J62_02420 [Candidatus Buchananbacteria bacterium RIFCSPHIGHO2_02_FULL_38_8]